MSCGFASGFLELALSRNLFLTQVLPYPLDAGPKLRAYYTLRHLAARYAVTLVSFVRDSDRPESIAHLEQFCERVITVPMRRSWLRDGLSLACSLVTGEPFLITRDRVPDMAVRLKALFSENPQPAIGNQQFDVIHADQLWMAPYALVAGAEAVKHGYRPKLVLDQHNAVHLIPRRLADSARNPLSRYLLSLEAAHMARYESRLCQQFDHVVWVTAEDQQAVQAISNQQSSTSDRVIPICLDPSATVCHLPSAISHLLAILFLGGMHWPPNADGVRWFVRDVLPRIWARVPGTRFFAVGKNPLPEIQLQNGAGRVVAPGYVDEPQEYWERSRVFVVPLRAGGGMRVKILDAWARGLPVVSTTIGAEGIAYRHGDNILIADTPEDFAEAVVNVLSDDELAERLARRGRATVEEHYDWRKVYGAWDEVYDPRR